MAEIPPAAIPDALPGPAAALPYFDLLLRQLERDDPAFRDAFGQHVHWGAWADPARADGSVADFAAAAARLSALVIAAAEISSGQMVLDAGCGFGGTVAQLNAGWQGLELIGLNIDPRQLARAAARVQQRGDNSIRWIAADACAMPLPDRSLDALLAVECIFHFPSREAFFAEAARLLRPGGRLALCDFVPTRSLRALQRLGPAGEAVGATYGPIDCTCSMAGYRALARRHGFTLLRNDDITRATLPTYRVVAELFGQAGEADAVAATRTIGWLSRLGLLRYRVLAFARER